MTETAPIRVPLATRDQLRLIAAQDGVTIPTAISRVVADAMWRRAFAAEREAARLDAANPAAVTEDAEWDETSDDGLD
jgi:hypothetical protein